MQTNHLIINDKKLHPIHGRPITDTLNAYI